MLAAITLDTKRNLRFIRTGSAAEGARVALIDITTLLDSGAPHWDITMTWDPLNVAIEVRPQHDDAGAPLKGHWSAPT